MKRDARGRFAKGNKGGPGRPNKKREDRYYEITTKAIPFKQWLKIIQRAATKAERGDMGALRFLADYLLGKPQQLVDITTLGEKLPGVIVYLPKTDELEAESGTAGEVSS